VAESHLEPVDSVASEPSVLPLLTAGWWPASTAAGSVFTKVTAVPGAGAVSVGSILTSAASAAGGARAGAAAAMSFTWDVTSSQEN